jgi:hypothetical protein
MAADVELKILSRVRDLSDSVLVTDEVSVIVFFGSASESLDLVFPI